jgi:hypothetical protein
LRKDEMRTMFRIGCSRGTMASLILAELLLVFLAAGVVIALAVWLISSRASDWVGSML